MSGSTANYNSVGFISPPEVYVADGGVAGVIIGETETEVIVAFRGTLPITDSSWEALRESLKDWVYDAEANLQPGRLFSGYVHAGFARELKDLGANVYKADGFRDKNKKVIYTGHSKGGALASISAIYHYVNGFGAPAVYTFASAKPGDSDFAKCYNNLIAEHYRFENYDDIVPFLPAGILLVELLNAVAGGLVDLKSADYSPVGILHYLGKGPTLTVNDSLRLSATRDLEIAEQLACFRYPYIASRHSLANSYIPALQELVENKINN